MDKNFDVNKYLENSVKAYFAEAEEPVDEKNQSASFYLKKALEHLHEVDLYLSAATDPNIKRDIDEDAIKAIRNINVHGSLSKIEKELKAIKQK